MESVSQQKQPESPREIIDAFAVKDERGKIIETGRIAVSKITGASRNAVSNWYRTGIPPRYHHTLVGAARKKNINWITHAALLRLNEQVKLQSAIAGKPSGERQPECQS